MQRPPRGFADLARLSAEGPSLICDLFLQECQEEEQWGKGIEKHNQPLSLILKWKKKQKAKSFPEGKTYSRLQWTKQV